MRTSIRRVLLIISCIIEPTDGGEWRKISVTGEVPDARTHHSSTCVWQDKMVVFSGGDCGTKTLDNSVYLFDMGEWVSH